ncbi:GntR family transcriptional regulator [Lentzea waywayandensis]|uniref:GntR family transcriptional regulator n=1 Tax=Lentzea waywayandensis TaxID=84724 RepID=UPI0038995E01
MASGPGRPATYASIADDLRGKIATSQLPCGATVPSTGDLAATYRVAPSTAHRAITQLAHERLVVTTSGHRTIVAPRAVADSQAGDDAS